MLRKATTTLAALLVLGTASVVWADANNRTDGSFGQRPVSMVSNGRTGVVNHAAKPLEASVNRPTVLPQDCVGYDQLLLP